MKIIVLFFLSSCVTERNLSETIIIGVPTDVATLDPHATMDSGSSRIVAQIFNRLFEKDQEGNIYPSLVLSSDKISPLIWEFTLRPNVFFHNNEVLTAHDVVFSLNRMKHTPGFLKDLMKSIESVEFVDILKFRIKLHYFDTFLFDLLSHNHAAIMHEKTTRSLANKVAQYPIGTGAFKFKEHKLGNSILLERHDKFFGGCPDIKYVLFRKIVDSAVRMIAFETGELDISYIDPTDIPDVITLPYFSLLKFDSSRMDFLGLNLRKKEFQNILLRRMISYSIDRKGIVDTILHGAAHPLIKPLPWMIAKNFMSFDEYVDFINEPLFFNDAHIDIPTRTFIFGVQEGYRVKIAEAIQNNLIALGIKTEIQIFEYATFLQKLADGAFDLFLYGKIAMTCNPDEFFRSIYYSTSYPILGNAGFYKNLELDSYIDKGVTEFSFDKRKQIYQKISNIVSKEYALISLYSPIYYLALNQNIKGFYLDSLFSPRFDNSEKMISLNIKKIEYNKINNFN